MILRWFGRRLCPIHVNPADWLYRTEETADEIS